MSLRFLSGLLCGALLLAACGSDHEPVTSSKAPSTASVEQAPEPEKKSAPRAKLDPLPHHASPRRAMKASTSKWLQVAPSQASGLIADLALDGQDLWMVTTDGELFSIKADGTYVPSVIRGESAWVSVEAVRKGADLSLYLLDDLGGVYVSRDGGATMEKLYQGGEWNSNKIRPRKQWVEVPFHDLSARLVGDDVHLFAAGVTTFMLFSRDGGKTWKEERVGGLEAMESCTIDSEGTFFAVGERGRGFRRKVGEDKWTQIYQKNKPLLRSVAVDPKKPGVLLVIGEGGEIRFSDDGGTQWVQHDQSEGGLRSAIADPSGGWLAINEAGELLKSTGDPARWKLSGRQKWEGVTGLVASEGGVSLFGESVLAHRPAGSKTWNPLRGAEHADLLDVRALSNGRSFAVGEDGLLLRGEPDGKWLAGKIVVDGKGQNVTLSAVDFAGGRFGWIVTGDGRVLSSKDGGESWSSVRPDEAWKGRFLDVAALDPRNVIVGGEGGRLFASQDGGGSWRPVELPLKSLKGVPPGDLRAVSFEQGEEGIRVLVGAERGQLVVGDIERKSFQRFDVASSGGFSRVVTVEGRSWAVDLSGIVMRRDGLKDPWRVIAVPPGLGFSQVVLSPEGEGVVVATSGLLLYTADGGKTWMLPSQPSPRAVHDIVHVTGRVFVSVGHGGTVRRTEDGGKTWSHVTHSIGRSLNAVSMVGDRLVAVGFQGAIWQSQDEGKTWTVWEEASQSLGKTHLTCMDRHESGHMALGAIGSVWSLSPEGVWTALKAAPSEDAAPREFQHVQAGPGGEVLAVSARGELWARKGDALHLVREAPLESERWLDVKVLDWGNEEILAVLGSGVRRGSLKDPSSWKNETFEMVPGTNPEGVSLADGSWWVVGTGGLWGRVEGQEAWSQVIGALPGRVLDLSFRDTKEGFAVGQGGLLLRTEDGGLRWEMDHPGTWTDLHAVSVRQSGEVLVAGKGGLVLRRPQKPASP